MYENTEYEVQIQWNIYNNKKNKNIQTVKCFMTYNYNKYIIACAQNNILWHVYCLIEHIKFCKISFFLMHTYYPS